MLLSTFGGSPKNVNDFSLLQNIKALAPMLVTLAGIVRFINLSQAWKAAPSILVTLSGIVILLKLLQPLKVIGRMVVTP